MSPELRGFFTFLWHTALIFAGEMLVFLLGLTCYHFFYFLPSLKKRKNNTTFQVIDEHNVASAGNLRVLAERYSQNVGDKPKKPRIPMMPAEEEETQSSSERERKKRKGKKEEKKLQLNTTLNMCEEAPTQQNRSHSEQLFKCSQKSIPDKAWNYEPDIQTPPLQPDDSPPSPKATNAGVDSDSNHRVMKKKRTLRDNISFWFGKGQSAPHSTPYEPSDKLSTGNRELSLAYEDESAAFIPPAYNQQGAKRRTVRDNYRWQQQPREVTLNRDQPYGYGYGQYGAWTSMGEENEAINRQVAAQQQAAQRRYREGGMMQQMDRHQIHGRNALEEEQDMMREQEMPQQPYQQQQQWRGSHRTSFQDRLPPEQQPLLHLPPDNAPPLHLTTSLVAIPKEHKQEHKQQPWKSTKF